MGIYNYVSRNNIKTPIKLEIGLDKIVYDRTHNGNDAKYLRVFIEGKDVTTMIANAINLKMSYAKGSYGCLIIHGTGMDIGFALQDRMYRAAYQAGYPDMFDRDFYTYLRKKHNGKYPYQKQGLKPNLQGKGGFLSLLPCGIIIWKEKNNSERNSMVSWNK